MRGEQLRAERVDGERSDPSTPGACGRGVHPRGVRTHVVGRDQHKPFRAVGKNRPAAFDDSRRIERELLRLHGL